jgi:tetratricopeptide (TPR) repeat protein
VLRQARRGKDEAEVQREAADEGRPEEASRLHEAQMRAARRAVGIESTINQIERTHPPGDSTVKALSDLIKLNPSQGDAYVARGDAYRAKGDYDRAIADYNEAIRLHPTESPPRRGKCKKSQRRCHCRGGQISRGAKK